MDVWNLTLPNDSRELDRQNTSRSRIKRTKLNIVIATANCFTGTFRFRFIIKSRFFFSVLQLFESKSDSRKRLTFPFEEIESFLRLFYFSSERILSRFYLFTKVESLTSSLCWVIQWNIFSCSNCKGRGKLFQFDIHL